MHLHSQSFFVFNKNLIIFAFRRTSRPVFLCPCMSPYAQSKLCWLGWIRSRCGIHCGFSSKKFLSDISQVVCGQNANRTKCQPDIMPTKGWHFVRTFFRGWHFVRPNFLVGILSGPSQHVLVFCPIGPSRCEISFSILFIQYPTHLGQPGPPMGIYGQI